MSYRLTNPFTLLFAFIAVLVFLLAAATARYRSDNRATTPLVGLFLCAGLWSMADALRIAAPVRSHVLFWNKVSYLAISFIPVCYILFVAGVTGRERWFERRYVAGLLAISVTALAVVLTNPLHGLWRAGETVTPGTAPPVLVEDRGILWYAWAAFNYPLVTSVALYVLGRDFLDAHRSRTYRTQVGLVLLGSVVAIATTGLFVFGVVSFDPTPIGFAVMGAVFGVALFRYQLLDLAPIARDVVVANMDSGVVVLDPEDRVVDANRRAVDVLDVDEDAIPGVALSTVLAEQPEVLERFEGLREASETLAVDTEDGTRYFDVEVSPIHDDLDTYLGRVVVFNDVTDRIHREERLEERTEALRDRNERLDRFAAIVSHDLRNPLSVAGGYLETARETGREEHFEEVRTSLDRMETLIDEMLVLARQGEPIDETEPVDLRELATDAWDNVATDGAELATERDGEWTVEADRARLLQVFENLFRNAVEHNDGSVTVTVGALEDGPGFFVADDGNGIPPEERGKVFDHGYTTDEGGTGFGLAIVEEVVDAHGWDLRVTDAEDGGARFEVATGAKQATPSA